MGNRRKSREIALQGLYMNETVGTGLSDLLMLEWIEDENDESTLNFARNLIEGALKNISIYDDFIRKYSKNWKFERISPIEKAILRLSMFELFCIEDIPPAISIDEAIELGKLYGSENSGQFINGILDSINKNEV